MKNSSPHFDTVALVAASARMINKAMFCLVCSSLLAQNAAPPPHRIVYNTAASVLSLPYDVAEHGGLAAIKGTVTLTNAWGLVVQDGTGGIWVDSYDALGKYVFGDEVVVVGPIGPGQYSPRIGMSRIRLIGHHHRLPIPKRVTFLQLSSGEEDSQYVSIEGTVRAVNAQSVVNGYGGITLSIAMPQGRVDTLLPSKYSAAALGLVDAKVRIAATALCLKNDNMQATGVILVASDFSQIEIIRPGPHDLFNGPILPIDNLLRYRSGTNYFHRVRVQGILTYYEPGNQLMLQDGAQAIEVFSPDSAVLKIGDRVEAAGFPAPDASGPILRDAVLRQLGHGTPLVPLPLSLQDATSSRNRFCLVSIEMHVLRVIDEPSRTVLLLERGDQVTTAELGSHVTALPKFLVPGSTIRVTGIDVLTGQTGLVYGNEIHSQLLLRTLNDVSLVASAPWWTKDRLFQLVMVLGALALGIFFLLLYVQLKRWKMETVLLERERLAHDIHDTLAQSFAGIGFQLQVIRKSVAANDPNALSHVDVARKLVQFSHKEARRSLSPTAPFDPRHGDLLTALKSCAQCLPESGAIEIKEQTSGIARPLPAGLNEQLFRIGQEAIANAIRHANPTRLTIALDYRVDTLRLAVRDNGHGFVISGDLLGFGIRGMRKRASEIRGELDITSSTADGTCVSITVPFVKRNRLLWTLVGRQNFPRNILES